MVFKNICVLVLLIKTLRTTPLNFLKNYSQLQSLCQKNRTSRQQFQTQILDKYGRKNDEKQNSEFQNLYHEIFIGASCLYVEGSCWLLRLLVHSLSPFPAPVTWG